MRTPSSGCDAPSVVRTHPVPRFWPVLLLIGMLTGCNESADRVVVSGTVTFNGAPIQQGKIRFFPDAATDAPMTGASIVDGHYLVDAKGGVPIGKHRVEIVGFQAAARATKPGAAPIAIAMSASAKKQFLPPQFNTRTTLSLDVPAGAGQLTQDYPLTGVAAK